MSSQEPIEKLYVKIEADVKDLLERGEAAIQKLHKELDTLDKKGKQVGRFEKFKQGLDRVVKGLRAAQAAALAFGAALVAAFRMAQQAIADLRVERSFYRLADAAGQSGEEIITAMRRASKNAVDDLTLMQQANLAMQLGVAKTPEEFEKLTRSAIALGAAVGRGPTEAINDLVIAAGRRSRLVLDNLGLSLGEVNRLIEQFAQQEFGKTADQLSQIQRDMLFTRATIEAANRKAEQLGGNLADAGTDLETLNAQATNLRTEFGQTSLVFFTLLNQMGQGPGLLKHLTDGAKAWQRILLVISALLTTMNDSLKTMDTSIGKIAARSFLTPFLGPGGAQNAVKLLFRNTETQAEESGEESGKSFTERFTENLQDLEAKFQDVLDPEAAAEGLGVLPGPSIDEDPADESAQKIRDIFDDLKTDMLNEQDDTNTALEELEQDHAERMADIAADGAKQRLKIEEDYQDDLADLAKETAKQRAEIFEDTQRELEKLASDTNERLNDERQDFQTEERRDTEDHLRDMRRLTQQYLFDLEDAVKERDARAVVDLQRRFAMESQQREEDFSVNQQRDREDSDQRLAEIRDNEAKRRNEILRSQAEELADLMEHEQERRAEIEASRQEQLERLNEQLAEARAREIKNYAERQAELQNALAERLQAIAKELAAEKDINEEGARAILSTLANYFGLGGEIDRLMEDYMQRMRQYTALGVDFAIASQTPQSTSGRHGRRGMPYGRIPRFQHGGQMVARRPTLAMFGEGGPEVATFTPMNRAGGGGSPQRIQIEFMGSAPPGIRSTERDQIANVLLNALRDTGALTK